MSTRRGEIPISRLGAGSLSCALFFLSAGGGTVAWKKQDFANAGNALARGTESAR